MCNVSCIIGALVRYNHEKKKHTTLILIDVDYVIEKQFASEIFTWLGSRGSAESFYITNGINLDNEPYFLQDDVIVLAYATRSK